MRTFIVLGVPISSLPYIARNAVLLYLCGERLKRFRRFFVDVEAIFSCTGGLPYILLATQLLDFLFCIMLFSRFYHFLHWFLSIRFDVSAIVQPIQKLISVLKVGMILFQLILIFLKLSPNLLIEGLQFLAAQFLLHRFKAIHLEFQYQHALLVLAAGELKFLPIVAIYHQRRGLPPLDQFLPRPLEQLNLHKLPGRELAGPQLIDILKAVLKHVLNLAMVAGVDVPNPQQVLLQLRWGYFIFPILCETFYGEEEVDLVLFPHGQLPSYFKIIFITGGWVARKYRESLQNFEQEVELFGYGGFFEDVGSEELHVLLLKLLCFCLKGVQLLLLLLFQLRLCLVLLCQGGACMLILVKFADIDGSGSDRRGKVPGIHFPLLVLKDGYEASIQQIISFFLTHLPHAQSRISTYLTLIKYTALRHPLLPQLVVLAHLVVQLAEAGKEVAAAELGPGPGTVLLVHRLVFIVLKSYLHAVEEIKQYNNQWIALFEDRQILEMVRARQKGDKSEKRRILTPFLTNFSPLHFLRSLSSLLIIFLTV